MSQNVQAGDVSISAIVLSGQRGTVSLTNLLQMMTIYEDVTLPGINCEVVVLDDSDLNSVLPLIGEEILYVNFSTPSLGSFTHSFYVTTMTDANPVSSLKSKAYMITGVAQEVLAHKTTLVNKSYNTNCSNMVQDIFQSFLNSNKSFNVEKTKGIQQYIVDNKKPFVAIKDILLRSVSESHESSSYVFFENANGYHFRTMEDLFNQGASITYTNAEVTSLSIFQVNFRNILGYNLPDQFNTADKLGKGAFASTLQTFDLKTLLFGTNVIKPDTSSMKFGMNSPLSSSSFKQAHSTSGVKRFVPKDSTKPDTGIDQMIPKRSAYAAELDQGRVIIRVFGDSSLTVGTMINLQITQTNADTSLNIAHPLIAGNYMINRLKHVILPQDVKPQYTQIIEAISGSYAQSVG